MTSIQTVDYVTAAEAARLLGVTRQRVATMVKENEIEYVRPWPRQVLIPRYAVDRLLAARTTRDAEQGRARRRRETEHQRQRARRLAVPGAGGPIHKTATKRWLLDWEDVDTLDAIDSDRLAELVAVFIADRRPGWDTESQANWCVAMVGLLR